METHILVVDDEKEITELITLYLQNEGYFVHAFYDGASALAYTKQNQVDLAVMDVMMPGMDGFSLCSKIRIEYTFPIIMVTAKETQMDKITGLTLGADDYITKPFHPLELLARVKAQLRRYKHYNKEEEVICIRGLRMDISNHVCYLNERELALTPIEFSLLELLCQNAGRVLSSEELFEKVWQEKYYANNNTVMVHIRHLREKMQDCFDHPKYIKTVWGVGYKIEK